jgi:hypothetical protein
LVLLQDYFPGKVENLIDSSWTMVFEVENFCRTLVDDWDYDSNAGFGYFFVDFL